MVYISVLEYLAVVSRKTNLNTYLKIEICQFQVLRVASLEVICSCKIFTLFTVISHLPEHPLSK